MAVNTSIASSLIKFTFSDEDGDVVASFRLNPTDIKLAQRFQELSAYFENLESVAGENVTIEDVVAKNDEIEENICKLLGYDARKQLFGFLPATTIMADGRMFVVHVVEKMREAVEPVIAERKAAMTKAVEKYTAKYE